MNRVSTDDPAYSRLRHFLVETTGLTFRAGRDNELAEFIGQRLSDLDMPDCSAYAGLLANSPESEAEMDVLIERFAVGETYFFRDSELFAAIRDTIIPDILERKQFSRRLRIWSAGCATGAEPYSVAILLMHEMASQLAGWQVSIEATDLNRRNLTRAAAGKFREWAFRGTASNVRRDCFSTDGRLWTIQPRFKKFISFRHMNLVDGEFSTPWPADLPFDLILCRNVMIYFTPEVNAGLIGKLHGSLADGGWLVVGGCEHNPETFQAFRTVTIGGAVIYQKSATADKTPPALEIERVRTDEAPTPRPDIPDRDNHHDDTYDPGPLAGRDDWQGAAEHCKRLLTRDRLNPEIHFHLSVIFEQLGIDGDAEKSLRQAIYLDRNFAMAHYRLALLLEKDGRTGAATRSFRNVLKIMAGERDDAAIPSGGGVTVTGLKELTRLHLENRERIMKEPLEPSRDYREPLSAPVSGGER